MKTKSDLAIELLRAALLDPTDHSRCALTAAGLLCDDCPLGLGDLCLLTCMLDPVPGELNNDLSPENVIREIIKNGNSPKIGKKNLFMDYSESWSPEEKTKYKNTIKGIYRRLPYTYKATPHLPLVQTKRGEPANRFSDIDLV